MEKKKRLLKRSWGLPRDKGRNEKPRDKKALGHTFSYIIGGQLFDVERRRTFNLVEVGLLLMESGGIRANYGLTDLWSMGITSSLSSFKITLFEELVKLYGIMCKQEYDATQSSTDKSLVSEPREALISACVNGVLCTWSSLSGRCRRRKMLPWGKLLRQEKQERVPMRQLLKSRKLEDDIQRETRESVTVSDLFGRIQSIAINEENHSVGEVGSDLEKSNQLHTVCVDSTDLILDGMTMPPSPGSLKLSITPPSLQFLPHASRFTNLSGFNGCAPVVRINCTSTQGDNAMTLLNYGAGKMESVRKQELVNLGCTFAWFCNWIAWWPKPTQLPSSTTSGVLKAILALKVVAECTTWCAHLKNVTVLDSWKWCCLESLLSIPCTSINPFGTVLVLGESAISDSALETVIYDATERWQHYVYPYSANLLLLNYGEGTMLTHTPACLESANEDSILSMLRTDGGINTQGPLKWFLERPFEQGVQSPQTMRLTTMHVIGLWLSYPTAIKFYMKELKLLTLYGGVSIDEDLDGEFQENSAEAREFAMLVQSIDPKLTEAFETRSAFIAAAAAVPSYLLQHPVMITLDRDINMMFRGYMHTFLGKHKVGFSELGKILALDLEIYNNGGNSLDMSLSILEHAMFQSDKVYEIQNVRIKGKVCFTNLPSNTALQSFGDPQGMLIIEMTLDQLSLLGQGISLPLAQELVGLIPDAKSVDLLDLALSTDTGTMVKCLRELMEAVVDPLSLTESPIQEATWENDSFYRLYGLIDNNDSLEAWRNVTSTKLLKQRKKEESRIPLKEKRQKCKPECIEMKVHVEEASTHGKPSPNQVPLVENQLQRENSYVQMGKKMRLLKRG
eukprot:Gb_02891 [translate_table: standard]